MIHKFFPHLATDGYYFCSNSRMAEPVELLSIYRYSGRLTTNSRRAGKKEIQQPWLFSDGASVDVKDVLFEVIRPTEVLAAESAGEGVSRSKTATFVPGVSGQRRSRPVPTPAH